MSERLNKKEQKSLAGIINQIKKKDPDGFSIFKEQCAAKGTNPSDELLKIMDGMIDTTEIDSIDDLNRTETEPTPKTDGNDGEGKTKVKRNIPSVKFDNLDSVRHKDFKSEYDMSKKLLELSQRLGKEAEAHAIDVEKYAEKMVGLNNQIMQLNAIIADKDRYISLLHSILTQEQAEQVRRAMQPQGYPQQY